MAISIRFKYVYVISFVVLSLVYAVLMLFPANSNAYLRNRHLFSNDDISCNILGGSDLLFHWNFSRNSVTYDLLNGLTCDLPRPFYKNPNYMRLLNMGGPSKSFQPPIDSTQHSEQKPSPQLNVLLIGDSFDLHSSWFDMEIVEQNAISPVTKIVSKLPFDPHHPESQQLTLRFDRIYGIRHKPVVQTFQSILEAYGRNESDSITTESSQASTSPAIDAIVFSSVVWDIRNSQSAYCRSKLVRQSSEGRCYCNFTHFSTASECRSYSDTQIFNLAPPPWCDDNFVTTWTARYLEAVSLLRTSFPEAVLFLRNQPHAAAFTVGGDACINQLNAVIRHTARTLCRNTDTAEDTTLHPSQSSSSVTYCESNLLDIHSLLLGATRYLGYTSSDPFDRKQSEEERFLHLPPRSDALHYYPAAGVWRDYTLNVIVNTLVRKRTLEVTQRQ